MLRNLGFNRNSMDYIKCKDMKILLFISIFKEKLPCRLFQIYNTGGFGCCQAVSFCAFPCNVRT